MDKVELIRHEIEKRRDHNLTIGNPLFAVMAEEDIELLSFIDSLQKEPVKDRFAFKAIPRLLDMIEPSERAKSYVTKLADAFDVEGYHSDAEIVRESLKMMNGEKVAMATMDEEPVSEELEEAANNAVISLIPSFGQKNSDGSYVSSYRDCFKREEFINLFMAGAKWKEQMIKRLCNHANIDQMVEKFEDKYKPEKVLDTEYYKRGIFDTIKAIKED